MKTAPYGSWKSPITAEMLAAEEIPVGGPLLFDGGSLYWAELRPSEEGRIVVVRRTPDGRIADVTPPGFNASTRVHEYGGGAYLVADGAVFFSNFSDQRLYRQDPGVAPRPLTPAVDLRYADGVFDRARNRILCVREDHTGSGEAVNTLVAVQAEGDAAGGQVLVSGSDFVSSPRLSPDGKRLAWLTWNHPNMPWDGTELWVGEFSSDGTLGRRERIAGGVSESIAQPEWSPDGILHFCSDRTGWWNLYRAIDSHIEPLHEMKAEFTSPQWLLGRTFYSFESAHRIICRYIENGVSHLASLDTNTGELTPIETGRSVISYVRAAPGQVAFIGGSPTLPDSVIQLDLAAKKIDVLRRSSEVKVNPGYFSIPQVIEFPTENGLTAFGFFYAPKSRDYRGPARDKPPLTVISHGGPTSASETALKLEIQYWTTRGFAVLDVNYGGSTGYGRAYRERLYGKWGIVDVDDCINGARYLAERGWVDGDRIAVRGGSAGGYTTLAALTFRSFFKAGASYYGISDLEAMAKETHKFESRYLDHLIGPYPQRRDLYVERSPIHFTERLNCPMILFQGLEDKVVPPNQSQMMFDAVYKKGLPVAYLAFEGEQHGFRRASTIRRTHEAEYYFYSQVFGFSIPDKIEPVKIENLGK